MQISRFFQHARSVLSALGWCKPLSVLRHRSVAALAIALGMTTAIAADTAQLSIADGVVVKFGQGAGISVRGGLHTGSSVVLTSSHDDSQMGPVQPQGPQTRVPQAGDWLGVLVAPEVAPASLKLDGLAIRYAGGTDGLPSHMAGGAALVLGGASYGLDRLQITDNAVGVKVVGSGTGRITRSRVAGNGVGILTEQGATPAIGESDISGNTQFGIRNTSPASIVQAQGNWWGHASGPRDAVANPAGQGNAVSTGVDYGSYLTAEPVLACTIVPTQGYATRVRAVELRLDCPQAAQFRLQESDQFDGAAWQNMAGHPTLASYTLSVGAGDKMIHAQFRTAQGGINQFSLAQPIAYTPEGPLVQFAQPAAGAVLEQDTAIAINVTDPEGVQQVEILVDGRRLALLTEAPFQTAWALAAVRNGNYTLQARATNGIGLSNTATRPVQVQKKAGQGPALTATLQAPRLCPMRPFPPQANWPCPCKAPSALPTSRPPSTACRSLSAAAATPALSTTASSSTLRNCPMARIGSASPPRTRTALRPCWIFRSRSASARRLLLPLRSPSTTHRCPRRNWPSPARPWRARKCSCIWVGRPPAPRWPCQPMAASPPP
jgi:hypothetical protein